MRPQSWKWSCCWLRKPGGPGGGEGRGSWAGATWMGLCCLHRSPWGGACAPLPMPAPARMPGSVSRTCISSPSERVSSLSCHCPLQGKLCLHGQTGQRGGCCSPVRLARPWASSARRPHCPSFVRPTSGISGHALLTPFQPPPHSRLSRPPEGTPQLNRPQEESGHERKGSS